MKWTRVCKEPFANIVHGILHSHSTNDFAVQDSATSILCHPPQIKILQRRAVLKMCRQYCRLYCVTDITSHLDMSPPDISFEYMSFVFPGGEPWTLEYPGIEKPSSINHGPKNGFNCSGSLGFIYQAMGVHSAVINGRKQIDHIDRDEMVSMRAKTTQCDLANR